MLKESNRISYFLGTFIILVIVFLNALGPYFSKQSLVTVGMLPLLAGIAFIHDVKSINQNKTEFLLLVIIFLTSFSTAFYYKGYEEFIRSLSSFFGAVMSAYIVIGLTKEKDYSLFFHIGFILSILFLFIIEYTNGNISLLNFASVKDYRDRFMLNANAYSYFCVFGNFSLFYLYLKKKTTFLSLLLICLPLLFVIIAFSTQSRAGLILVIFINIVFWSWINKGETKTKLQQLMRKVLIVAGLFLISLKFIDIYQNSQIKNRMDQVSTREDSRETLIKDGLVIFTEHYLLGVGLGQFPFYNSSGLFSHNSFVEILAEQGLFAGILLFIMFLRPMRRSIKNLQIDTKNPMFRCHVLFFITFLMYNNAYVFYKFPFSMMYFFLIVSLQYKATPVKTEIA